jgi:hypothetical protein
MKLLTLSSIVAGACAVLLAARPSRWIPDEAAALRRAGALLWEMSERHQEFSDGRRARRITPADVKQLTESTAGRLRKNRDALARLLPALAPDSRFAIDLARFLQRWPKRDAFLNDLMLPPDDGRVGADISSLAMQVRDTRRTWKTLFPFFRP